MKTEQWLSAACVLGLSLVMISSAAVHAFADGTGTADDPYQIATAAQLISIGGDPNLLDRHFVLVADIDLDPNAEGGKVFQEAIIAPGAYVMGSFVQGGVFSGTFDGQRHTIRRLHISMSEQPWEWRRCGGLFGGIGAAGVVHDLALEDVAMATTNVPALGGLAGCNAGRISRCATSGEVAGNTCREGEGGLVGVNTGTISECVSYGHVSGDSRTLGGLVGENWGQVSDCYATGSVEGGPTAAETGGLIGRSHGQATRCYAAGSVTSGSTRPTGGLIGSEWGPDPASQCYFLRAADGGGSDNGVGITLSDAEMRQQGSFVAWDFYGGDSDGLQDTWSMPSQGYPILTWQSEIAGLSEVPEVIGLAQDQATAALAAAGYRLGQVHYDYDGTVPAGRVVSARPAHYAPAGSAVTLWVSLGGYDWQQNPGKGTADSPYQIAQPGQLSSLHTRPDLWGSHFVLMDDLDMDLRVFTGAVMAVDTNLPETGFQGQPFAGRLDGNHHSIRNLRIDAADGATYVGLLGYTAEGAEVVDLRLENLRVSIGAAASYIGGLTGYSKGSLARCSVEGTITGNGRCCLLGGLVGFNEGVLTQCGGDCRMSLAGSFMGGLVGVNKGQITLCSARGQVDIRSPRQVGGVAGGNYGQIADTYSTFANASGLVGTMGVSGSITVSSGSGSFSRQISWDYGPSASIVHCYAAGHMQYGGAGSAMELGGLIGNYDGGTVAASLWDMEASGLRSSPAGVGLTTQQMMDPEILGLNGWADDPNWILDAGRDYPRLAWEGLPGAQIPAPSVDWLQGQGTLDAPYRIANAAALARLSAASLLWDRHFVLESDLDLAGLNWVPIGRYAGAAFSGTLDGQSHVIRNLGIALGDSPGLNQGLFGYLSEAAVIANLTLDQAAITGNTRVENIGPLAGYSAGTAVHCNVSGMISGYGNNLGGLIGRLEGAVTSCQSSCSFANVGGSSQHVGGLVGENYSGWIVNCRATGAMAGGEVSQSVGGLVGFNHGYIAGCYATGAASGKDKVGGLVGDLFSGSVVSSYFLSPTSGGGPDNHIGSPLSTAQMQIQDNFAGWDFAGETAHGTVDAWQMPETGGRPILRHFQIPTALSGKGTDEAPYLIASAGPLALVYDRPWACYRLVADIDLTQTAWITPVIPGFAGVFDGNGHRVRGLKIANGSGIGLFGRLAFGSSVSRLGLVDVALGTGDYDKVASLASFNSGTISQCYAKGQAIGSSYVGGLVAVNKGRIVDCYTTSSVRGQYWTGGLVGYNVGELVTSCAIGRPANLSPASEQALVGYNEGHVVDCFWDMQVNPGVDSDGGLGRTTSQMMDPNLYGLNGWADSPSWVIDPGRDYPHLAWEGTPGIQIQTPAIDWFRGSGSSDDPYLIEDATQLRRLATASILWDKVFALVADIDLGGVRFEPIGVCPGTGFKGSLDGRGHLISHLSPNPDPARRQYIGLFGMIEDQGRVSRLSLDSATVTCGEQGGYIGCLAGRSDGQITQCGARGTMIGRQLWCIGGLVGSNYGRIRSSYTDVALDAGDQSTFLGGLVGGTWGTVQDCYALGPVHAGTGSTGTGGLLGYLRGDVANSYAAGTVQGDQGLGGLVGASPFNGIVGCYFLSPGFGGGPDNGKGVVLTTDQTRQQASFVGWDFVDAWTICEGKDSPRLQWQQIQCP